MFCPSCNHENPADHRFCGFCGTPLRDGAGQGQRTREQSDNFDTDDEASYSAAQTHYPPAAYDQGNSQELESFEQPAYDGSDIPPELVEYDKTVPIIAEEGTDRRQDPPEHLRRELHAALDRIDETRPNLTPASRPNGDPHAVPARSVSVLGLSDKDFGQSELGKTEALEQRLDRDAELPLSNSQKNAYFEWTEPQDGGNVSGPSFLGLSGAENDGYYEDEEEPSHWRRNLALAIVLGFVALGIVQWRAIRDLGLWRYARAGTQEVTVRGKGAPPNPAAAAAPDAGTPGGPDIKVDPLNSRLKPAEEPPDNPAEAQPPAPAATDGDGAGAGAREEQASAEPEKAEQQTQDHQRDATASGEDDQREQPAVAADDDAGAPEPKAEEPEQLASARDREAIPQDERDERSAKPSAARRGFEADKAGEAELKQASSAGDPELVAALLWRATKKGSREAPVRLAEMYIAGRGVPQNCEQALILLRSAAERGTARARSKLGALYGTGQCVQQDRVQAYQWVSRALEANPNSEWTQQYQRSLWSQMSPEERSRVGGQQF